MEYILLLNPLHSFVLWEGEYIVEYILGGEKSCGIYCARGEILQNILWDVEYMLLTNPIHSFALCEAEYTLGGWIYCEMYCGIYSWLWKMMWDIFWEIFCNILWDVEYMLPLNPLHSFALWELPVLLLHTEHGFAFHIFVPAFLFCYCQWLAFFSLFLIHACFSWSLFLPRKKQEREENLLYEIAIILLYF